MLSQDYNLAHGQVELAQDAAQEGGFATTTGTQQAITEGAKYREKQNKQV